jgi:orotidine-5'-phosphate decarboxylase
VTVLTSIDDAELRKVGQAGPAPAQVERLARLAKTTGLDGVVCSAQEIEIVRRAAGKDFLIVTPGIRPAGADLADQRRVTTPTDALASGANILVIGRPITGAADPARAARQIAEQLDHVQTA